MSLRGARPPLGDEATSGSTTDERTPELLGGHVTVREPDGGRV